MALQSRSAARASIIRCRPESVHSRARASPQPSRGRSSPAGACRPSTAQRGRTRARQAFPGPAEPSPQNEVPRTSLPPPPRGSSQGLPRPCSPAPRRCHLLDVVELLGAEVQSHDDSLSRRSRTGRQRVKNEGVPFCFACGRVVSPVLVWFWLRQKTCRSFIFPSAFVSEPTSCSGIVKMNAHALVESQSNLWCRCTDRLLLRFKFQAPPPPPGVQCCAGLSGSSPSK